jgi:hypothetical protein
MQFDGDTFEKQFEARAMGVRSAGFSPLQRPLQSDAGKARPAFDSCVAAA